MNKLLKGSIAGAAGIALLMGGAGTFALWNDSATVDGGSIVAGNLALTYDEETEGTWTVAHNGGAATAVADISAFRAVPGDVLTYTSTVGIEATGDNLVATLALGSNSVEAADDTNDADVALADYLELNAAVSATGTGITAIGTTGTYRITNGASSNATVSVVLTFPKDEVAGFENDTMLGSVDFSSLSVTLTQN